MNYNNKVYQRIVNSIEKGEKLLAILVDPDKTELDKLAPIVEKIHRSPSTHIFVGGSTVDPDKTDAVIKVLRGLTDLPILIFPGDVSQVSAHADGLLFLSLVSGRNPDYLIGKHIEAVSVLRQMQLEIIPTGYMLIENGKETAVERVTQTEPLSYENMQLIIDTAMASQLLGMKCVYLEAGSGALEPIRLNIIKSVKRELNIPLIVGGGIGTKLQLDNAYTAGADIIVIGTAFEENASFFEDINI